jgi:hypothetical protein
MFEIKEFCDRIDLSKPNIFQLCKENKLIDKTAGSLDDLTEAELILYKREVSAHYDNYRNIWKHVIQDFLPYKKPNLVNV